MLTPDFPGFENVIPLPEPPADDRVFSGSRLLFREAAIQMGVALTEQEYYDWSVILGAAMLIDHIVDIERTETTGFFNTIMSGEIRPDLDPAVQIRAINYMARQKQDKRKDIFDKVSQVEWLATAQRLATTAEEVIAIRITEADILSSLLCLSTDGKPDHEARDIFNSWLSSWSRVGYLIDSVFDIKKDFDNNESGVVPSPTSIFMLAKEAIKESAKAIRKTPPKILGKCALNGFNYVVRQKRLNFAPHS